MVLKLANFNEVYTDVLRLRVGLKELKPRSLGAASAPGRTSGCQDTKDEGVSIVWRVIETMVLLSILQE